MRTQLWQSRLEYLASRRNGYLLLACISLLLNLALAGVIALISGREKVILVPPAIERPLSVTSVQVSPEYLSAMSLFLSDLLLNVTPGNAVTQHALFMKYVGPEFYGKLKGILSAEEEKLRSEHMTVSFSRQNVSVDVQHLAARITGIAEYRIGSTLLSTSPLTYQMKFDWHLGQLRVTSFQELKKLKKGDGSV